MCIPIEIQKLSLDPGLEMFLQEDIKKDNQIMYQFGLAINAIKNGKYKNNKLKMRLKLEATKNEFIDIFLLKFLKRKEIIINIKNNCIINYFKYDYDKIMKELDELLIKPVPIIPKCDCRTIGFGFCFCHQNNNLIL